jgi:hypothetical protein
MPNQLMRQRPADPFEEQGIVRVLQYAAMTLPLDVRQILASRSLRRIVLAHVTQPTRELRESLTIGALTEPRDRQMLRRAERGARENGYPRLEIEVWRGGGHD